MMLSKALKLTVLSLICATIAIVTLGSAAAKLDPVSQIQKNNAEFSKILNAKADPEILFEFMHNKVDNDAEIFISVKNPQIKNAGAIEMKLTKTDYINSYLYGPRQVKNYHADIKTLNAEMDDETNTLKTREILTESGIMLNPHDYQDKGRPYTSYTSCDVQYGVDGNDISLKRSQCQTQIAYEEAV